MSLISDNYIKQAITTEVPIESAFKRMDCNRTAFRILHGAIGMSTEAGELLDNVKKYVFYGKPIDTVNVQEEIGDTLWYIAIICHELNIKNFDDIMETNIEKLRIRYPEKFKEYDALNRNLGKEREVLEQDSAVTRLNRFKNGQ